MGGRSFQAGDQEGLRRVLSVPGVQRVLEVGPGCWRFAGAILAAGASLYAVELPFPRSAAMRPAGAGGWFSWRPHPLPWPTGHFQVAYQRNAVPNLETGDIGRALAEIARVADLFVWVGDLRCRFPIRPGRWVKAKILEHFAIEEEGGVKEWRVMALKPLRLCCR